MPEADSPLSAHSPAQENLPPAETAIASTIPVDKESTGNLSGKRFILAPDYND